MSAAALDWATPGASRRGTVWAALLVIALLALSLFLRMDQPLNHDVAWLATAAERMWGGGTYLEDFFEVNAPLAIGIYLPAHLLTLVLATSMRVSVWAWAYGIVVFSLGLAWAVQRCAGNHVRQMGGIGLQVAWLAVLLAVLPGYDFAQKEHFIAMLVLPFLYSMSLAPETLGARLRAVVTLFAAVGCFLKPHFVLLPVLLLIGRAVYLGWRSAFGIELRVFGLAGALYAFWILQSYPDWLQVLRWAVALYSEVQGSGVQRFTQTQSILPAFAASALLVVVAGSGDAATRRRCLPFAIATAYAWTAYLLQGKGWRYQLLPAAVFALAWLPVLPWRRRIARSDSDAHVSMMAVTSWALMAAVAVHAIHVNQGAPRLSNLARSPIGDALSIARAGDGVHVISTSVIPFFPAVAHLGLRWGSRFSALWPLAALGRDAAEGRPSPELAPYHSQFVDLVAADLRRFKPEIAIVDLRPGQFGVPEGFDMLGYLSTSRIFAREWHQYGLLGQSRDFAIFVRRAEVAPSDVGDDEH